MENKELIVYWLKEGKRYWGELLIKEYADLFQKIRSSPLLAEIISKDLGHEIKDYQIQNIKSKYLKTPVKPVSKKPTISNSIPITGENIEQKIYDEIYNKSQKGDFSLDNL